MTCRSPPRRCRSARGRGRRCSRGGTLPCPRDGRVLGTGASQEQGVGRGCLGAASPAPQLHSGLLRKRGVLRRADTPARLQVASGGTSLTVHL